MLPDNIRPVHDYGDPGHISDQRAARMTADDADAFKGDQPTSGYPHWRREWTQHEAQHAISDRHVLMHELARALETIAKLTPTVIEKAADADLVPDGTVVMEANGEISEKRHDLHGAYWQSPGDDNKYRSTRLCYPLKVLKLPTAAWIEEEEQEQSRILAGGDQ